MNLDEELKSETTVEDKLRRLVTFFTSKTFDNINMGFDLINDVDNADRDYFLEMMAGVLSSHFEISTEPDFIANCKTLGDLASYIHSAKGY
uniref:Carrier domain-containing protein n=1 Tax=Heterorhabditis bacteriophora TaxID=37862 RepID=A0A1I7X6G2_HETBA